MARCSRKTNLAVHHIKRTGDNSLSNAKVLCQPCHSLTASYGTKGTSPPDFSPTTKVIALHGAKNQCECTSNAGCH